MLLGDLGKGFAAVGGLWESIAAMVVDLRSRYPMTAVGLGYVPAVCGLHWSMIFRL